MYIPKTRSELYMDMAVYVGYAPDFTKYKYFNSQEEAEYTLYTAIDNVFSESGSHAKMKATASAAFLACREGRIDDAMDSFRVIIDELS